MTPQEARERAEARGDWYVIHGGRTGYGTVSLGPFEEGKARSRLLGIMASDNKWAKLLRVVEDYEA